MLCFETRGTPFERGRQQGLACRELASPRLKNQLEHLTERFGLSSTAEAIGHMREFIDRWKNRIAAAAPELIEEFLGIADGLDMDEHEYFAAAWNGWLLSDIFFDNPLQCTTLAFRDTENRPLLAKTDDIGKDDLGINVLEITFPDQGYRHVHFHFAASIWSVAGMNESGFCMAMNGTPGPTLDQDGLPSLESLHTILPTCRSVSEAIEHIRHLPVNCYGFSLMIGDADGELALVEKNAINTAVLPQQSAGFLLHTNHLLDSQLAAKSPSQKEPIFSNGVARYENALRIIDSLPRSQDGMKEFLRNRNPHGPICQQGEGGLHTDFGVLFSPTEKRTTYWPGYPVSVEEQTLDIASLFTSRYTKRHFEIG
ncbi:MAG: C45 family peptidase [bacterium]